VVPQVTTFTTSRALSLSATASALAEEALAAIATVKAFCAEEEETKRYSEALHGVRRYGRIVGVVRGLSLGEVQLLVFSCYASSLWLGAFLVQEELIQAGEFVTVFFAVLLVGVSVGQALPHLQTLVSANAAGKRLQDIVQRVLYVISEPTCSCLSCALFCVTRMCTYRSMHFCVFVWQDNGVWSGCLIS
jgi:ABC-type bacteriocin/lantibiotic exporter with double-glycine peptidase domain